MSGHLKDDQRKWILKSFWKNKNAEKVRMEWRDAFHSNPPSRFAIYRIRDKFEKTGSVENAPKSGRPRSVSITSNEELVAQTFVQSPKKSTRRASLELDISLSSTWRLMRKVELKPYRPRLLQHLLPDDAERRLQFAVLMLSEIRENPDLLDKIVWSDEASFKLSGHVNRHNCVYWFPENPHMVSTNELNQPGLTVWAGMSSNGVIGPVFFERTVTAEVYLQMLQSFAIPEMQSLNNFNELYFQQDGAPAHFAVSVRSYLNDTFPGKWIGRCGSILWPPRSPDLTPMDFFFWGVVKEKVYGRKPHTLSQLRSYITDACQEISDDRNLCRTVCHSVAERLQECADVHGGHFEHLRS